MSNGLRIDDGRSDVTRITVLAQPLIVIVKRARSPGIALMEVFARPGRVGGNFCAASSASARIWVHDVPGGLDGVLASAGCR
jgi:hypothetical protein